MGQIKENTPLLERQHAIIRTLENTEMSELDRARLEEEKEQLETRIQENVFQHIKEKTPEIRVERPSTIGKNKNEVKKLFADWMDEVFKDLDQNTRKGIYRAAYKRLKG